VIEGPQVSRFILHLLVGFSGHLNDSQYDAVPKKSVGFCLPDWAIQFVSPEVAKTPTGGTAWVMLREYRVGHMRSDYGVRIGKGV
jgi:hypothetical protein